jgi:multidrug efflux pump subunit AcrA (membrane-fusion protein)
MNSSLLRNILFLCALLPGCTNRHAEEDDAASSALTPVVAVKTAEVTRGTIGVFVTATGRTDAIRREKILAPIGGTLVSLNVLEGKAVRRGDVVAVIQPRETRSAIIGAEALLRSARTDTEREEAQRALQLARSTQNTIDVHATVDGVVATRNVGEGELVTENAELMTIVDQSTIVFVADVPLKDLSSVRTGERADVSVQSLPELRFDASVDAIHPQSDLQSQTVKVRLRFRGLAGEAWRKLKTEMSGVARIQIGLHENVLLVPKTALLRNDETGAFSIVVMTPDSLARALPVIVSGRTDSTAEVSGTGLSAGMPVIVEGNYALPDSTRVSVVR